MNRVVSSRLPLLATMGVMVALAIVFAGERAAPATLLPHGYCFTWNPPLLWTHVVSDTLIGLAYVSIPITLVHLVRKRTDMPFNGMVVLFAVFIVSCGATHWAEVWTVWWPDYWLSGSAKVVTAIASVLTAAALVRLVPKILAIPTVAQLTAAKEALEVEVRNRRQAEEALLVERSLLERRVLERTEALAAATSAAESAHAAAEEANRLKDRFLAKVSHELRTPLQSTLSWAQVLKQPDVERGIAAEASERIAHNVRSQARLIDDLLDISRILSGKLSLEPGPANAVAVVHKAAEVVRSGSMSRGIAIEVETAHADIPMLTDAVRLEQVTWNLINNAVQATSEGGRVRVRIDRDGSELVIEVRDWGRGIDPNDLPHLFEPFRQSPGGRSSHRGLGLGLAITRSIVEMFDGALDVHSDGPGRGARFTVRVPISSAKLDAYAADAGALLPSERTRLEGIRVLYVEDEADIAHAGQVMLTALGADVRLCSSYEEARRSLQAGGFDVLLTDLNLGEGRTALDLMPLLRSLPHGGDVPAIVLSAYGSVDDRAATREAGFARHIVKPADAVTVARAILDVVPD